ncbi:MAG: hypothetical protein GC136_07195 [Alphaproteobacteria bacterium]|nr:hypothetical protein [Alphaproteobacteria bacterium]
MAVIGAAIVWGLVSGVAAGAVTKVRGIASAAGGADGFNASKGIVLRNVLLAAALGGGIAGTLEGMETEADIAEANICPRLMESMESGSADRIIIERNEEGRYECRLINRDYQ